VAQTKRGILPVVVLLRRVEPEAMAMRGGKDEAALYFQAALFEP
jgi:hypothetical protein